MKKATLLIITILFLSTFANAQVTITPYVQGDYSTRIVLPKNSSIGLIPGASNNYAPKSSYAFGINIRYDISSKWALKTGVMFQDMGDKKSQINFRIGNLTPLSSLASEMTNHYHFISAPVLMQYNFNSRGRFLPYLAVGGGVSWNVNNYYRAIRYQGIEVYDAVKRPLEEVSYYEKRIINFLAKMDVGFCYKLTERFDLNTFISNNVLLLSANKSSKSKPRYFNIGLGLGVGYAI